MGLASSLRRIDLRHAKRDLAILHQATEPIELLPLLRVGAHEGGREADIALRDALKAADGGKGAAVANGGDDKLIEHRTVREPIDAFGQALANSRRDITAPSNDDIGAKRRNKPLVFLGRIGDDRQPFGFGKLDDIAAISARGAGQG
jgi:hypothetical protein